MSTDLNIEAIEARKKEIEDAIAKLQEEAHELDVALSVFRRFSPKVPPSTTHDDSKLGPPRPEGVPTLFEMAYTVIRDAEQRGRRGLPAKDIVEAIANQYWPGLQAPQITPSLYAFVKKKRLTKSSDGLFHTIRKKEAPPVQSDDAPKPEGQEPAKFDNLL
ncbi:hypothetical protein LJR251_003680 [Rhizobium rhizogenes]|jgi:uncharacterized protein YjhX (UPF0386 family)|uniref:hypothetical protein n=1 Tax=Rhizobium rhizogenes TaxID=359 RepID=UPI003ECE6B93